jgi:ABC-type Na+ efflux pump permease subunit
VAALSRQVEAMQRQPSGNGEGQPPDVTALVQEVRELGSIAANGQALAADLSPPTLLDAIVAKVPEPTLTLFYPLAAERPRALLPEIVALVACFLPFVIAAQSLLREREARTAEILLAAPGMTPASFFVGKLGLPLLCGLFEFGLIVVLVQLVHHVYVKPGLATMVLVLLPAMGASALLGLATSAWVGSAAHATIVTAMYLLVITLFSGFLYPIASHDPRTLLALSTVSPLTFVHPAMKSWMFGAPVPFLAPFLGGFTQLVAYGAIAVAVYRRWLNSI